MKNIKFKMGMASIIITAVVIACVIILNSIIGVITQKHPLAIDLTKDKVYEFSNQTKDVMKNLGSDVKAYALIPEGTDNEYVDYIKTYLDKYVSLSDKFTVEYIDPYENPAFMNSYADNGQEIGLGSVIIECGEEYRIVAYDQLYTQSYYDNTVQIDMEKKVTNAIMSVTGAHASANIYFTTGHNEFDVTNLKELLADEGYSCADVSISREGIPDDAHIVMCIAPQADFTAEERDALDAFMDRGGRFVLAAHPGMVPMERLDAYLEEWGLRLNYDYVVETAPGNSLAFESGMAIPAATLKEHTINEKLIESDAPLAMPYAMSISTMKSTNGASVTQLLSTSEQAYGKVNLASTNIEKEEGDIAGPLCMAAISERIGDAKSGIMVIGSSLAIEYPQMITEGAYLNGDFILNSLSYISGVKTSSDIRAKQISPETMTMTQNQVVVSMVALQYVLPAVIILLGLFVWLRRRFK